ncbi:hypothetical protein DFH09DRAFT_1076667 [Mycena vulgaris]|nr:hypothetical protein DFH09DRAFT_1076667 [Mycena vulgaris]
MAKPAVAGAEPTRAEIRERVRRPFARSVRNNERAAYQRGSAPPRPRTTAALVLIIPARRGSLDPRHEDGGRRCSLLTTTYTRPHPRGPHAESVRTSTGARTRPCLACASPAHPRESAHIRPRCAAFTSTARVHADIQRPPRSTPMYRLRRAGASTAPRAGPENVRAAPLPLDYSTTSGRRATHPRHCAPALARTGAPCPLPRTRSVLVHGDAHPHARAHHNDEKLLCLHDCALHTKRAGRAARCSLFARRLQRVHPPRVHLRRCGREEARWDNGRGVKGAGEGRDGESEGQEADGEEMGIGARAIEKVGARAWVKGRARAREKGWE